MIQPNELRVGNLFQLLSSRPVRIPESTIFKILEIHAFSFSCVQYEQIPAQVEEWLTFPFNKLSPIPLTPEWLERFGFSEKNKYWSYPCGDGFYIAYTPSGEFWIAIERSDGDDDCGEDEYARKLPIKYVHQLQNLYHSLTGKELEIKPI